jgi:plastocyanin
MSSTSAASLSAATTTRSGPRTHLVRAGAGDFDFEPAELNDVSVGDVVTFEFYPPDHSIARAEYGSPCMPYEYTGRNKTGFWSGTHFVNSTSEVSSLARPSSDSVTTDLAR